MTFCELVSKTFKNGLPYCTLYIFKYLDILQNIKYLKKNINNDDKISYMNILIMNY